MGCEAVGLAFQQRGGASSICASVTELSRPQPLCQAHDKAGFRVDVSSLRVGKNSDIPGPFVSSFCPQPGGWGAESQPLMFQD